MIKNALFDILPQIPRWDAENKAAKVGRSSQIDTVSSFESSFGLNGDLDNDVRGGDR
jgi:hypothetical protein